MRGTKELKSVCLEQGRQCFGQAFPMISMRLWENVEYVKHLLNRLNHLEMLVKFHPHAWHTLGTDLFYWNKIDCLVVGDYFSKYLIVRKLPNSSTHAVIKELGLIFTEFGRPFIYASREFHNFLSFYQVSHIISSPHYPQSNGFAEALVGIAKKLMEKSVKDGKLWNYGLMQYRTTPISANLPSPLEALTGRKPRSTLPKLPSAVGNNMETSKIHQELLRRQLGASRGSIMELGARTTSICQGSSWKCMENWYN